MQVTVNINKEEKSISLLFSEKLPEPHANHLGRTGFKRFKDNERKWYANLHPVYRRYAEDLKALVPMGRSPESISLYPSFAPTADNINNRKFSLARIFYIRDGQEASADYLVFDTYRKVVRQVAEQFALKHYGKHFKELKVFPRNFKVKARELLKQGKVIDPDKEVVTPVSHEVAGLTRIDKLELVKGFREFAAKRKAEFPEVAIENHELPILFSGWMRANHPKHFPFKEQIWELYPDSQEPQAPEMARLSAEPLPEEANLPEDFTSFKEEVITRMVDQSAKITRHDAEDILDAPMLAAWLDKRFRELTNPDANDADRVAKEVLEKITKNTAGNKGTEAGQAITGKIQGREKVIPYVLLPAASGEPFWSGRVMAGGSALVENAAPGLFNLNPDNLGQATAIELFELVQLGHPTNYGIRVGRGELLAEWEKRGKSTFQKLGYPVDPGHPYVNIHTGYKSVETLGQVLSDDPKAWWTVAEHWRPVADAEKTSGALDNEIRVFTALLHQTLNPKTGKPRASEKERYQQLAFDLQDLLASKQVLQGFIDRHQKKPDSKTNKPTPSDYLDRVIAHTHEAYGEGRRPTRGQIEKLGSELSIPNKGVLWEAVELGWLLWYKMIYRGPAPFQRRLDKMVHFWHNLQPTYAYSDSSKELYRQYSTPCPIGVIVAQYTGMDQAGAVFEPSAGNGLLLVGADPARTHVNEIDPTRLKSLQFQQFSKVTSHNASQPFPKSLTRAFDVVVTNPPFSRWEEEKYDKEHLVSRYFNNHIGLVRNIRLEHLMCGLALHTLKDTGRAALIIMGHVRFGPDGLVAKYRPFFNWLYRHYQVDDVINLNSFKLYNKQGTIERTMLILVSGRKSKPEGVAPTRAQAPELDEMVDSFQALWERVSASMKTTLDQTISQLNIELNRPYIP